METRDAIQERRSIKQFDPKIRMTPAEIDELMSLAKLSPTAYNQQNTRFVVVQDPELREQLREAAWGQAQVTDASILIILCADTKAWEKEPVRYWQSAPQEVQDYMSSAMDQYYRNRETVQRDEAMRSAGIAAQTIMLAAKDMGFDTCPMDGFDFDAVGKLINLPEDHVISLFVAVGKPLEAPKPRPTQLSMDEMVIHNCF